MPALAVAFDWIAQLAEHARLILAADQLLESLALLGGKLTRDDDLEMDDQVAVAAAPHARQALAAEHRRLARLGPGRHADLLEPIQDRHLDLATKRGAERRDLLLEMQVGLVANEQLVCLHSHHHVEIALGTASRPRLAFADQAQPRAVFNAGRDIDAELTAPLHPARSVAGRAWVGHGLPRP